MTRHASYYDALITAATTYEPTMATEGVLLPIGATGFLLSILMLAAFLV